jgi:crotonobetainyl-CoA:carnitine CoA-transferase CaiB-like acyl-CoA transferase
LRDHTSTHMTATARSPLEGMLVLDLGQVYHGPYCGLLLSFMGARVLKIEPPEGDIVRRRKRNVEPYPLVMLNSNKESVVLDFKHPEGKAASWIAWASAGRCYTPRIRAWSSAPARASA